MTGPELKSLGTGNLDIVGKMMMALMAYTRFYWEKGAGTGLEGGIMKRTTSVMPDFTLLDQGMGGQANCDSSNVFNVLHKRQFCGSKCGPVATAASECDAVLRVTAEFTNVNKVLTLMVVPTDNYLNLLRFPNMLRMIPSDNQASSADAVFYAWFKPKNYNLILCEGGIADQDRDIILSVVSKAAQNYLSKTEQVTVQVGRMKSKHLDLAKADHWFLRSSVNPQTDFTADSTLSGLIGEIATWADFRSWLWGIRARCGRVEPNLMNLFLIAGAMKGIWTSGPILLIDDTIFQGYYVPYMLGSTYALHYFSPFLWGSFAQRIKAPSNDARTKFFNWIDSSNSQDFKDYVSAKVTREGNAVGDLSSALSQKTNINPDDFAWMMLETAWLGINTVADVLHQAGNPTDLDTMKAAVNKSNAQSFSSTFRFNANGNRMLLSYEVVQFHGVKDVNPHILKYVPALPDGWYREATSDGKAGEWTNVGSRTETTLSIDKTKLRFNQPNRDLWENGMDNPFCTAGTHKPVLQSPRELCVPCPKGHDLVEITFNKCLKCVVGKFAAEVGTGSCLGCPPGRFITKRGASQCDGCAKGYWTASSGRTQCDKCDPGSYAEETGLSECVKCDVGKYQSAQAATTCTKCKDRETTGGDGKIDAKDCVCDVDYYRLPGGKPNDGGCQSCPDGAECKSINTTSNYPPLERSVESRRLGDSTVARKIRWDNQIKQYPVPVPAAHYWASYAEPQLMYRCSNVISCKGQQFGNDACLEFKEEFVCAQCVEGYQRLNGDCLKCSSYEQSAQLPLLICFVLITFCFMLHWRSVDVPSTWNEPKKSLPQLGSLLLNFCQTIALTGQCDIGWQATKLTTSMEMMGYTIAPTDLFRFDCMGLGHTFEKIFAFRLTSPLWMGAFFVLTFGIFKVFYLVMNAVAKNVEDGPMGFIKGSVNLNGNAMFTAYGGLFLSCYLMIASNSVALFQTLHHPEPRDIKDTSVVLFPEIKVGEDRYMSMIGLGVPVFILFCIVAPVVFSYLVFIAPKKFKANDEVFLMRFKFLFVKLQPRVWWWSPIVCLKCLSYVFATVMFDTGFAQVMWIFLSVCVYFFFMCFVKPWRFDECNVFDIVLHLCVIGFIFLCQSLLFKMPEFSDVLILIDFAMYLPFGLAFLGIMSLAWQHLRPPPASVRLQQATEILAALKKIDENREEWNKFFATLTRQEQSAYTKTVEILQTEFGDPNDNKKAKRLKSSSGEYKPTVNEANIKELPQEPDEVNEPRVATNKKNFPGEWD